MRPAAADPIDALIRQHAGLACSFARHYSRRTPGQVRYSELRAAALEGLWRAAEVYDPASGRPFAPLAYVVMGRAVANWLREADFFPNGRRRSKISKAGGTVPHMRQFNVLPNVDGRCDTDAQTLIPATGPAADPGAAMEQRDTIKHLLTGLTRERRMLLMLYYVEGMTMGEAGAAIGFSESRASQIMGEALAELRRRHAGAGQQHT